jgi:hypothetical protein
VNPAVFVFVYAWVCLAAIAGLAAMVAVVIECGRRRERPVADPRPVKPADEPEMAEHAAWMAAMRGPEPIFTDAQGLDLERDLRDLR